MLMLGFESAHHPVDADLAVALEAVRSHGGEPGPVRTSNAESGDASSAWRDAFLAAPYLRDSMVSLGVLSDTFETAITWDRLEEFHAAVIDAARRAVGEPSVVSCRFTHAYADGPAPYFDAGPGPARLGDQAVDEIKRPRQRRPDRRRRNDPTHHHAVGRDHRVGTTASGRAVRRCPSRGPKLAHWILREC